MSDDPTRELASGPVDVGPDVGADVRADAVEERAALDRLQASLFRRRADPITLGRYRLDERLAAGGMGVVYDAWDPELERRVAVKLLQPRAQGSAQARARLLREAQAMARLSHPNIVPVYDVGTYDAGALPELDAPGVFVVMELVEGERLDAWLRARPRSTTEILEVFTAAGRGLEAAHAAGIVHRDFKPGNVIVGADGRVRVLDFGLAFARDDAADDERGPAPHVEVESTPSGLSTPLTMTGSIMGTPAYMAPEQHAGTQVDARADQFAFCVALYEALYGARPFPQREAAALARAKARGEVPAPPRGRGVNRKVEAAVLRGLSPAPEDRHRDMASLCATLSPRRFARGWIAGGMAAAALVGGALAWWATPSEDACTGHEALRAQAWNDEVREAAATAFAGSSRPYAAQTWREVERRIEARLDAWSSLRRETCERAVVRGEVSPEWMHRVDACADRHLARLQALVGVFGEADDATVDGAIESVASLPPIAECEHAPLVTEPQVPEPIRAAVAEADATIASATALMQAARYDDAAARAERARARAVETGHAPVVARALLLAGELAHARGEHERAVELLGQALLEAERGEDATTAVEALLSRASASTRLAHYPAAADDLDLAQARIEGRGLSDRWQFRLLRVRGGLQTAQGELARARETLETALALGTQTLGPDDLQVANTLNSLGAVEDEAGRLDTSLAHFTAARAIFERALGPEHPNVAMADNNLGNVLLEQERVDEALAHFEHAHAAWVAAYGDAHPRVGDSFNNLGNVYKARGELDRALQSLTRAHEIWRASLGETHPSVAIALLNMSGVLLEQGELERARELGAQAVAIMEASLGPEHPHLAHALVAEGEALARLGRADEARPVLERAIRILEANVESDAKPLVEARTVLEGLL